MSQQWNFDVEPELPRINVAASSTAVRKTFGKGFASQLRDLYSLSRSAGRISAEEYFYFGLYDDARFSPAQKRMFVGRKLERQLHHLTCDVESFGTVHDKLNFYRVLESFGFPVPSCHAVYRRGAELGNIISLSDTGEVASYLRERAVFPFMGKPVAGMRSVGVAACDAYDPATDDLIMANGGRIAVGSFADALERYAVEGYLFQERVRPHETIRRACGPRIATVRVIVLIDEDGPCIHLTLWKIPTGKNIADNFWRKGNLLACVEPDLGKILRIVTGVGLECQEGSIHPDTGVELMEFQLPDWPIVRDLCLKVAMVFPNLRMQAFDIALSDRGPVVIEVNVGGDYNLPQLATGQGMLTPRFLKFLRKCAQDRDLSDALAQLRLNISASS